MNLMDMLYDLSSNTSNSIESLLSLPYFIVLNQYTRFIRDVEEKMKGRGK
jgi:hypothetical protein